MSKNVNEMNQKEPEVGSGANTESIKSVSKVLSSVGAWGIYSIC